MDPLEIKYAIERAGSTQTAIARQTGRSITWINRVIRHGEVSDPVRRAIARTIGKPVEEVWPEYYLRKAAGNG